MTNFDLFINNNFLQKNLAWLILTAMIANLIIGGIILPYQEFQRAQALWSNLITQLLGYIGDLINYIWTGVKWVYNNAQAAIAAASALWEKMDKILKEAIKVAWNILRKQLLNMLVNDIVKWIQNGTTPRFVTDWQGALKTAGDKAAGNFVTQKLGMGFLCESFDVKLKIALAKPITFDESAKCTISKISSNINNFFNDFSNGGWKGWLEISEAQNNIMGATLLALDEKYATAAKAQQAAQNEAISSDGYSGDKVCSIRQCPNGNGGYSPAENYSGPSLGWKPAELAGGDGFVCNCLKWEIRTPGRVAGDALQQAAGVDIANLIQAKEFAEYASAIIDAVINRVFREGVALMSSSSDGTSDSGSGPGITSPNPPIVEISSYNDALNNGSAATTLISQQKLLIENTQKVISEYQKNLAVLNQIKTSQINSLNYIKDTLQAGCGLPAGVSENTLPGTKESQTNCTINNDLISSCPCTATTTETVKIIANVGEGVFLKTVVQKYESSGFGSSNNFDSCSLGKKTIAYKNISLTAAVEKEISAVNEIITRTKNDILNIQKAIGDTTTYEKSANTYMKTYEEWQNSGGAGDKTNVNTAETAMKAAKEKAIKSNQEVFSVTSTDFNDFVNEAEKKSVATADTIQEAMNKKGNMPDCAYAQAATYQKDLCDTQAIELTYQTALNSCAGSGISF